VPEELIVHQQEPFNAETPRGRLAGSAITPAGLFYVRGHGAVPDPGTGSAFTVGGMVARELRLDVEALRSGFEARAVTATLQCAGNRRAGLIAVRDIPGEAPWGPGATGTAVWRGVALADVLASAGVLEGAAHVGFVGADRSDEADPPQDYGGSIPLAKAMSPEVLLVWEMNGRPLPAFHGGPLRVLVPGYVGARSVKWLRRIELRERPWEGYFQHVVYRLLPPDGSPAPGAGTALGEVALNADVLVPDDGAQVPAGRLEVRGYAFAGGDRHIVRVDVSTDGGEHWLQASLQEDLGRWAWRMWRAEVELEPGPAEILVRGWDSAAATQPEDPASVWNPKGYANNSWGRVRVQVLGR
jgi:sulfite oxidase